MSQLDQTTRHLIHGYLQIQQFLLPFRQNIYYTIPSLVVHLIATFFYNPEHFTAHGQCIKLNKDCDTATMSKSSIGVTGCNTVYGSIVINKDTYCNKFEWEFKISNVVGKDLILAIGLDTTDREHTDAAFDEEMDSTYYSYQSEAWSQPAEGDFYYHTSMLGHVDKPYGCQYARPDEEHVVMMEFDTKQMTLKYYVDGEDQGIACDDECLLSLNNTQYIAAISMNDKVTVQLLRFAQKYQ